MTIVEHKKRTAVLIVDMVKGFVDERTVDGKCAMYLPNARTLTESINELINSTNHDCIIIHISDAHAPNDKEFEMYPKHCIKDTEESEVADGFEYGDREVIIIEKTRFDGFFSQDPTYHKLHVNLNLNNVEEIIITGVCTDICVLFTAASARFRDYKVTVPSNCVSGLTKEGHKWALEYMERILGVKVKP